MTVYVVERHYDYEGSELDGIFATATAAVERARELAIDHCFGDDVEGYPKGTFVWWAESGSCQISVTAWEVK
jgi:hypothetical protein